MNETQKKLDTIKANLLSDIAQEMHEEAKLCGYSAMPLSRGLHVALYYREYDIVLALDRPYGLVVPSDTEIRVCKQAFFGDQKLKRIECPGAEEVPDVGGVVYYGLKVYIAVERGE